ncbi:MAG: HAD-IIIA family hydrolase [Deltaproteobacteria bacterium]|jgi:D-glycero-D-manno-heptose 1,7-bisphosphate phosphatase|nr:HAD-IIIA family hydrolase [Deltaproteobacteria bacterium]
MMNPINPDLLKNIFCDRDGTVIIDRNYLADPDGVELLPGASSGLARLTAFGLKLFLVTNQSGIGRGFFRLEDYQACQNRLTQELSACGVYFTGSAFCPHAPALRGGEQDCLCRKPLPGMWHTLSEQYGLRPENCVMVGDKIDDLLFGKNAHFPASILVLTGKGKDSAAELGLPEIPAGKTYLAFPRHTETNLVCLAADLNAVADYIECEREAGHENS